MPSPNNINILISVRNKASAPIREARRDLHDFRDELVKFNRRLFTASAVYATFSQGFRRAFDLAGVGAEFDFLRTQFNQTFGSSYLKTLRNASKFTMDATSMMQISLQNHARGMKKFETQKIFTLSVGAAKIMGTTTSEAAKKMSKAFNDLSVSGLQNFFVALNTNNQFKNMNVIINRLTKGLNSAKLSAANFRRIGIEELTKALGQFAVNTNDTLTLFMMTKAGFDDLRKVSGAFISRAINPLLAKISLLNFKAFDRLNDALDDSKDKFGRLRLGLVDFLQVGGSTLAGSVALVGGLSLLALIASTLGVTFGAITGVLTLFTIGLKAAKGENRSWLEFLADVGAELKFYFQAFSTYKDGISTFSKDVTDRLSQMPEATQNRILFIAKAFVLARVAINGFTEGVKNTVDWITKVLSKIGLWDSKTRQFSETTESLVKGIGKIAGVLAVVLGAGAGLKTIGSVIGRIPVIGGLLQKIPGIGGAFGGEGAFGRRGHDFSKPLYVMDVTGGIGKLSGVLGKVLGFGALAKGGLLAGAAFGGYKLGSYIDSSWKEILGKAPSEYLADMVAPTSNGFQADKMMSGGQIANQLNALDIGDSEAKNRRQELMNQVSSLKSVGGKVDEDSIRQITRDQTLTGKEVVFLLGKIERAIKDAKMRSGKMNSADQIF